MAEHGVFLSYMESENKNGDILLKSGMKAYFYDIHKIVWGDSFKKSEKEQKLHELENVSKINKTQRIEMAEELNLCIFEILSLISEHKYFKNAEQLDRLYKNNPEYRYKFFEDFHEAMTLLSEKQLIKDNPKAAKKLVGTPLNQTYMFRKIYEENGFYLVVGNKKRSEKQLYALAAYYAIDLAIAAFEQGDILSLSKLQSDLFRFSAGMDYSSINGLKGGKKSPQKTLKNKKVALEEYKKKEMYKDKDYNAAQDLQGYLKRQGIEVKASTIETDWIPEFKKLFVESV